MTPVVADAVRHYEELLGRFDPSTWWQAHRDEVLRHWPPEVALDAFVLRPYMIDEATYAERRASVAEVMAAFQIAIDRLANDPAMRAELGIPRYLEPLLELDRERGKPTVLGRLDGIASADGSLTLIEFNSEPQSAPFQYELERSFARMPIAQEFARSYRVRGVDLYDQTYDALAERNGGRPPCVAVIDKALWKQRRRAGVFRPLMYASARGCPVLYVDPEELEYRDGKLSSSGIQIDLVAFVSWELLINDKKRLVKVLKAIGDGAVGVFAGLSRGLLASYKVVFELLSSPRYHSLFSSTQLAALARHVAWTRLLRACTTDFEGAPIDLLPWVAANRERLVIKPSGGGGGGNIHIGRELDDTAWAAAIQKGVAQNWIVQRLAIPERQRFPVASLAARAAGAIAARAPEAIDGAIAMHELNCEYTPYVWNGARADGLLCRVVSGPVLFDLADRPIGISNGIETPVWIVEKR